VANTITAILPKIIARGLLVLRENAVMPRLVNNSYGADAASPGNIINIPLPSALVVTNVTAGATPPTPQDATPTVANVSLVNHKRIDFHMTDKDIIEVDANDTFIPGQMSEAFKKLANNVDAFILGKYTGIYNFGGQGGVTPFATNLSAFRDARIALNNDAAPLDPRYVVLDADAEGNAVVLEQFLAADRRGDQGGIIRGEIGTKLGATWYLDQNVPDHAVSSNAWAITGTGYTEVKAAATAGTSTMIIQGNSSTTTNGGAVVVGDVFKVTGDTRSYVVKTAASVAVGAQATLEITFSPVLRATIAAAATVLFEGGNEGPTAHAVNLLFHRDAFAFASRPLGDSQLLAGLSNPFVSQSVVDPVSGLAFRLEIIREYKQWLWDLDILYGANLIRPELAARILG
jgi:hypothetical protein